MLTAEQLRALIETGDVDTVVTCFTDMQGRLIGKRVDAEFFVSDVLGHGVEACDYLLALDMDMDPVPGYESANWERGYGDFALVPDLDTMRRVPWLDRTALVLCDLARADGDPVAVSPRQVLRAQVERAQALGFESMMGSELEFYLFHDSYAGARAKHYRDLEPSIPYILDYHVLATTMDEPYVGALRRGMKGAGIPVEFSKGEAWHGQHELNIRYAEALTMADNHSVYKNGAKEIAHLQGKAVTFMAKPAHDWIGSSCHIHSSLWADGHSVFPAGEGTEHSEVFGHYLGGLVTALPELMVLLAPNVNSYKRFADESWAPTTLAVGRDNRTCGLRLVGAGDALRVECRIPGADANPYLAFAAVLAAGLHGIETELEPPPVFTGNAYADASLPRVPRTLREATAAFASSDLARATFGDLVVDHYVNYARTEQRLFDATVTCYERERLFEQT